MQIIVENHFHRFMLGHRQPISIFFLLRYRDCKIEMDFSPIEYPTLLLLIIRDLCFKCSYSCRLELSKWASSQWAVCVHTIMDMSWTFPMQTNRVCPTSHMYKTRWTLWTLGSPIDLKIQVKIDLGKNHSFTLLYPFHEKLTFFFMIENLFFVLPMDIMWTAHFL